MSGRECSDEEWQTRVDLAACYRLIAHFGWDDLIYTHVSARSARAEETFLINPLGSMFGEIRARDLVKVDSEGRVQGDRAINRAGFVIHSAIHAARPDVGCVIHLHTRDGVAVSALTEGLLPLSQSAIAAAADLGFHDFEGPVLEAAEKQRLVANIAGNSAMILRNHGTLAMGSSVATAFHRMYFLEWACAAQVRTLAMGRPLHMPDQSAIEATMKASRSMSDGLTIDHAWPALLRMLDRIDPSYSE